MVWLTVRERGALDAYAFVHSLPRRRPGRYDTPANREFARRLLLNDPVVREVMAIQRDFRLRHSHLNASGA